MSSVTLNAARSSITLDRRSWGSILVHCRSAGVRLPARRFNARSAAKVVEVIDEMVFWLSDWRKKKPGVPIRGLMAPFDSNEGVRLICDIGDFIELAAEEDGFVVDCVTKEQVSVTDGTASGTHAGSVRN